MIGLREDRFQRLCLQESGRVVFAYRAFPLSAPSACVSLCDDQGHELHSIADLAALPAAERALIEADLARRDFMPTIEAVLAIVGTTDPTTWHVQTDRGKISFLLPNEDSIRVFGKDTLIVSSGFGVRYRIASLASLDPKSRKLLAAWV